MGFSRFFIELVTSVIVSVVVSLSVLFGVLHVLTHPERYAAYLSLPYFSTQTAAVASVERPTQHSPKIAELPASSPIPAAVIDGETKDSSESGVKHPIPGATAQRDSIIIGTGGITGVYYPSGGAICQMVNRHKPKLGISCSRESTKGSIYNIRNVRNGALQLGIAQSDWQFHAYRGTDRFGNDGPFSGLRALFSLHSESFTVVARADSGIRTFEDLRGKRVSVGAPGSGQRATLELLMTELGWNMNTFAEAVEIDASEQSNSLCSNQVDAFVYTVGHPSSAIQEAMATCDARLVEVSGDAIDKLINTHPYYAKTVIPGGLYPDNEKDVSTFGVKATVITSDQLPESTGYGIVKSVFENINRMKRMHPSFSILSAGGMATDGISAPLHKGAIRYFEETGLM